MGNRMQEDIEDFREIELDQINLSPFQMRKTFGDEEIQELADSIRSVGLIQPLVVRPKAGRYQLIAGERRYRALKSINRKKVYAIVSKRNDIHSAHAALVENIQRQDLTPLEIARCYQQLMHNFSLTQEALSLRVGKKRSTVANFLRLLSLPSEAQEGLDKGQISMGHAKCLLSLPTKELQTLLYRKMVRDKLSVREAERLVKTKGTSFAKRETDPHLEALREKLEERFFVNVSLSPGKIIFEYDSLDVLDSLLEQWSVEI